MIDTFTERLLWIVSELRGSDVREDFRREQIRLHVITSFPEVEDLDIINIVTNELYKLIYEDQEI